jgi:hypothetical protein
MRGVVALAMAVCLTACGGGFGASARLFDASDAVPIFGDHGMFRVPTPLNPQFGYPFDRVDTGYEVGPALNGVSSGAPRFNRARAYFIPIPGTPEDDYVVQIELTSPDRSSESVLYAFVLRTGPSTFIEWDDPLAVKKDEFSTSPADTLCRPNGRDHGECEFANRADLYAYYRTYVHDDFVRRGASASPDQVVTVVSRESTTP